MPPVASVEPLAFSVVSKKWVLRYRPLLISPEICVIIMRRYILKTIIMLVTVLLLNGHILSYLIISYPPKTVGIHTGKMRLQPAKCSRCSPEMMVDRRFSPTLLKQGHAVGIPCNQQYNRSRINFERCLHKCHSTKRINHLFYLF